MMPKITLLLLLGLAACGSSDTASDEAPMPVQGRRMASGKVPTKAEFGAVVASCQDRAQGSGGGMDSCLTDLGLRKR